MVARNSVLVGILLSRSIQVYAETNKNFPLRKADRTQKNSELPPHKYFSWTTFKRLDEQLKDLDSHTNEGRHGLLVLDFSFWCVHWPLSPIFNNFGYRSSSSHPHLHYVFLHTFLRSSAFKQALCHLSLLS